MNVIELNLSSKQSMAWESHLKNSYNVPRSMFFSQPYNHEENYFQIIHLIKELFIILIPIFNTPVNVQI